MLDHGEHRNHVKTLTFGNRFRETPGNEPEPGRFDRLAQGRVHSNPKAKPIAQVPEQRAVRRSDIEDAVSCGHEGTSLAEPPLPQEAIQRLERPPCDQFMRPADPFVAQQV